MENTTDVERRPAAVEELKSKGVGSGSSGSECAALDAQGDIEIGEWPGNVMVRLQLPVPVRELADILNVLSARAKGEGRQARMRQVGTVLEVFTIPNNRDEQRARTEKPS